MTESHLPDAGRTGADEGAEAEALAEELNRLWTFSRAFSNTAHDVNNGLQVIAGQAELLAISCTTPDAQRRLREIVATVARCAGDMDALVGYGRLVPSEARPQDVAGMIRICLQMRGASLARRRITMAPAVLPGPCLAVVDRARFMHLLLDLLLVCEDEAVRGTAASMSLDAEQGPKALIVRVQARWQPRPPLAVAETGGRTGGVDALAVAHRLAAHLGGRLVEQRGDGRLDLELEVPSARG